jgi:anti-sigma B factor antagonist
METATAPAPGLTLSARTAGRITVAELRGELDLGLLRRSSSQLVVDLSGVTYCDASGLAVLVGTERRARLLGGYLRLAAVPPAVYQVLQLTGLHRRLDMLPAAPPAGGTASEARTGAPWLADRSDRTMRPHLARGHKSRPRESAGFGELRAVAAALLSHTDAWHDADPRRHLTPVLRAMSRACGSGDDDALEAAARSLMSALARHPLAHSHAVAGSAARLRRVLEAGRSPAVVRPQAAEA